MRKKKKKKNQTFCWSSSLPKSGLGLALRVRQQHSHRVSHVWNALTNRRQVFYRLCLKTCFRPSLSPSLLFPLFHLTSCGMPPPPLWSDTQILSVSFFVFCFFLRENDQDSLFSQGVIRLTQMTHPLHQTNCPFSRAVDAEGFVCNPRDIKDKHRLLIPPYPLSL